jgi:hypothetical protein
MELVVFVAAVVVLDLLAIWFGVDSRNLDPYRRES